jgi:guanidinobutyrase
MPLCNSSVLSLFMVCSLISNVCSFAEDKTELNIPAEKLEILKSSLPVVLLSSMERFYKAMEGKNAQEIEEYLDGMIEVDQARKFNSDTDMASIPLNTETKLYNVWKVKLPQSLNPKREPGPIHLSRFVQSDHAGIRAFSDAPVAIYLDDLIAGNVDVAIMGAPLDMGSYYRGQRFGLQAMRNEYGAADVDMNTMAEIEKGLEKNDKNCLARST